MLQKAKAKALAAKRPHLGSTQRKYQYEVTVGSLAFGPKATVPPGSVCVLWTRGSKTAITTERSMGGARAVVFSQPLSLICTLFSDSARDGGPVSFAEKLCTFAAIEQGARGTRTVGKCKVDMAPYADVLPTSARPLTLTLRKGAVAVATVELTISSRWLKDYKVDSDGESISTVGSDSTAGEVELSHTLEEIDPADWGDEAAAPPAAAPPAAASMSSASAAAAAETAAAAAARAAPPTDCIVHPRAAASAYASASAAAASAAASASAASAAASASASAASASFSSLPPTPPPLPPLPPPLPPPPAGPTTSPAAVNSAAEVRQWSSQYRGVSKRETGRWMARMRQNGKHIIIGRFDTEVTLTLILALTL